MSMNSKRIPFGSSASIIIKGHHHHTAGTASHLGQQSHAHNNNQHTQQHNATSILLWMLLDGIGLAIIAACTILEGMELWKDYFIEYSEFNHPAIAFWICGRTSQVLGLIFLIAYAASIQAFPELEQAGMIMLTVGPILNMCACSIFDSGNGEDVTYLFNKQWMTSESFELIGISILDISMIDMEEYVVLTAEVTGFILLGVASLTDFDYEIGDFYPSATVRVDMIHVSDCLGLFMLTIVAIGQYFIKTVKHKAAMTAVAAAVVAAASGSITESHSFVHRHGHGHMG